MDCLERIKVGDFISPSPKHFQSDSNPAWSLQFGLVSTSCLAQDGFGTGRGVPGCLGGTGTVSGTTQCLHAQSELHVSDPDVHSLHLQSCTLHMGIMLLVILINSNNKISANNKFLVLFKDSVQTFC